VKRGTVCAWARLALVTAFLPAAAPAQDPPRLYESAHATVVEVPVHVLGRDGRPVAGLTASDFELRDDGVPQAITACDVVDLRRTAVIPSLPGNVPPPARRHWLFLFDLSFSRSVSITRAVEAAARFVTVGLAPADLAAVASVSVDRGVRLHLFFSSDRKQIVEAIRSILTPRGEDRSLDPLDLVLTTPGDPRAYRDASTESSPAAASIDPGLSSLYSMMARRSTDRFSLGRVSSQLTALSGLARALDTVSGRKTVLLFSEGFDSRLVSGSIARPISGETLAPENDAIFGGRIWAVDLDRRSGDPTLLKHLAETTDLFRRSDCTLYPIDIGGLKASDDDLTPKIQGQDSLFAFASGTGGELLDAGNDLEEQMRRVAEKLALTYILSFTPTVSRGEGTYHPLRVTVNARGARVSARAGYYESRLFRALSPLERTLSAADIVTHERGPSGWPLELLALPFAGEPLGQAAVVLEMPGPALLRGAGGTIRLGIYVYAVTEAGDVLDFFSRSVTLDTARDGARLSAGSFRYCGVVRLPAGAHRIRALLRDEEKGSRGFRAANVDMPGPGEASRLIVFPPLFLGSAETGVSLRDPAFPAGAENELFEVGGEVFVPELLPAVAPGTPVRICLMAYGGSSGPLELRAVVRTANGSVSAPGRFAVLGRGPAGAAGLVKFLVEFSPGPLPPGEAALRVTFQDPSGRSAAASSEAKFRVP
jgi:VWFA-related protein